MRNLLDTYPTTQRPAPGTPEEDIYGWLLPMMSRAGRRVDIDGCARLAHDIQRYGRNCVRVREAARELGLNPDRLPPRRTGSWGRRTLPLPL